MINEADSLSNPRVMRAAPQEASPSPSELGVRTFDGITNGLKAPGAARSLLQVPPVVPGHSDGLGAILRFYVLP